MHVFLLIYFVSLFLCTPANEECEFLIVNYRNSTSFEDKDNSFNMISRLELISIIPNYSLNFSALTLFTQRKLVIFSKLSTSLELTDFLWKVQNMKARNAISIGLLSETEFQLQRSYLATISQFDIGSSLYFCTHEDETINSTSSVELFIMPKECFELYTMKGLTVLKTAPLQPRSSMTFFEVPELVFHKQSFRRSNFFGIPIVAETVDYQATTYLSSFTRQSNLTNTILLQDGLEIEIYRCLRDALNFTEAAIESDGYLVMGENRTANNSGLAKSLCDGSADVSISLAEYVPYRMAGPYGVQYLHPVYRSQVKAFFVQPLLADHRNIFMMPFSWDLWLTIGIFIIFIYSLGVLFSFICLRRKKQSFSKDTTTNRTHSTHSTAMWILAAISQKGYYGFLLVQHAKILVFTTMVASQIIYVGYTSSMCSILSVDVIPIKKFQNFEHFSIYVDKYVPTIILRIEWLKNMSLLSLPVTQILKSDAISLILSSSSALVTTADEFYPAFREHNISFQDNSVCGKIDEVSVEGSYIQQGMFVKRGSPFREHFNTKLLLIRERGLQTRHLNKYFEAATLRCLDLKHSFFHTICLRDVVTAFVFLLLVYLLSIIALLIEVCQSRKRRIVYMW